MENKIVDLLSKLETALTTYTPVAYEKLVQMIFYKSAVQTGVSVVAMVLILVAMYASVRVLQRGIEEDRIYTSRHDPDGSWKIISGVIAILIFGLMLLGVSIHMMVNWEMYVGVVSPESRLMLMLMDKVMGT